jgi:hypothetical protein
MSFTGYGKRATEGGEGVFQSRCASSAPSSSRLRRSVTSRINQKPVGFAKIDRLFLCFREKMLFLAGKTAQNSVS